MVIEATTITVYLGTFASQQLVFAHLLDTIPDLNLDGVDVICGTDPTSRLAHAFDESTAREIEDALGLHTTVVLIFPEATGARAAKLPRETTHLSCLGALPGLRHRPG